jgi:hypothetical protein
MALEGGIDEPLVILLGHTGRTGSVGRVRARGRASVDGSGVWARGRDRRRGRQRRGMEQGGWEETVASFVRPVEGNGGSEGDEKGIKLHGRLGCDEAIA